MAKNETKTTDAESKVKSDEQVPDTAAKTEAKALEAAPAEKPNAEESTEGLVKVHKNGESLHVHPTTVEAHKAAGWNVA